MGGMVGGCVGILSRIGWSICGCCVMMVMVCVVLYWLVLG